MTHADTISTFILDTQIALFEDAKSDLQISFAEMSRRAGLLDENGKPNGTLKAWAEGRNALSLWGVKRLLRVKANDGSPRALAPFLSRLFEPEECALVGITTGEGDHSAHADKSVRYLHTYTAARDPESEAGVDIGPGEDRKLKTLRAA